MWEDLHDAQMRAKNTVVRYSDKPVYIRSMEKTDGMVIAYFTYLSNGGRGDAPVLDPLFNWRPVPCGMVNTGEGIHFVQRIPARKWKQGLSADNIAIFPVSRTVRPDAMLRSRNFARTVNREYPSYDDAIAKTLDTGVGTAFHHEFAVIKSGIGPMWLVYRKDRVGWYENGELRLGDGWGFLNELVQEVTHENVR